MAVVGTLLAQFLNKIMPISSFLLCLLVSLPAWFALHYLAAQRQRAKQTAASVSCSVLLVAHCTGLQPAATNAGKGTGNL
jgi:hypothetical protein